MLIDDLDHIDCDILRWLQADARTSNAELARRLDLSPAGLQKRLKKLEDTGVISHYATIVNREAVGLDMLCFIQVTLQRHQPESIMRFREQIQEMAEVLECHHITGEYDYLLKIAVRNRKHLESFLVEKLTPMPSMDKIRTSLVLNEIKSTTAVPLNFGG